MCRNFWDPILRFVGPYLYIYIIYDLYIRCICVTSIVTVSMPHLPQRLLTEEEARFRSLEAVANGAPVEQKDQCVDGGWGGSIPYRMPCIGLWGETRFKRFCLEVNSTTCSFGWIEPPPFLGGEGLWRVLRTAYASSTWHLWVGEWDIFRLGGVRSEHMIIYMLL